MAQVTCWKCGGSGYIPKYAHIDNGVCYACGGTGKLSDAQQKDISMKAFEKGTKKGGKTKFLFEVDPKVLDRKQLEKFRTRIKTRATELGVKLKAGFTTETALKKLWEAYKEEHKDKEHTGNRFESPKATEKPKEEPKKSEPKPKVEPTKPKEEPKPKEEKKPEPKTTATAVDEKPAKKPTYEEVEDFLKKEPGDVKILEKKDYRQKARDILQAFGMTLESFGIAEVRKELAEKLGFDLPKPKPVSHMTPMPKFGFSDIEENPKGVSYVKGIKTGPIKHPDYSAKIDKKKIEDLLVFVSQPIDLLTYEEERIFKSQLSNMAMYLGLDHEGDPTLYAFRNAVQKELEDIMKGTRSGERKEPTRKQSNDDLVMENEINGHIGQKFLRVYGGKAYTEDGIEIKNPITYATKPIGKEFTKKEVGDSKFPKLEGIDVKALEKEYGKDNTAIAVHILDELVDLVNANHKGLIANIGISDFISDTTSEYTLGWYSGLTKRMALNPAYIARTLKEADRRGLSKEMKQKVALKVRKKFYETIVHELSHAYHQQVFNNYDYSSFTYEFANNSTGKFSKKILEEYRKIMTSLPAPLNMKDMLTKSVKYAMGTGTLTQSEADLLKKNGFVTVNDIKNALSGHGLPRIYSYLNSKEFFATLSDKFLTNPKSVEKNSPVFYKMLSVMYEGVVDIEAIQKTYDNGQWE